MAGRGGSRTSAGWHQGRGAWREGGKGAGDGRSDFKWGLGEKIPASVAAAADLAHASAWRWASVLSGEDQGVFPRTAHRNRLKHSL